MTITTNDSASTDAAMTPEHPRWHEFRHRLEGPEGCNFHEDDNGNTKWTCAGDEGQNPTTPDSVHGLARYILADMGLSHDGVAASIAYFEQHGGYCDCEVLFNVGV